MRPSIMSGHSIQNNVVYDNHGNKWGEFASFSEAKAALDAYRSGFNDGHAIGKEDGKAEVVRPIKIALGI